MDQIVFVGVGFIGSIAARSLVRIAAASDWHEVKFIFIDPEPVEDRNVYTQIFEPIHKGKAKSVVLERLAHAYELDAMGYVERIDKSNIEYFLGEASLVIDSVDHLEARQLMEEWGVVNQVPVMHAGISIHGTGSVEWSGSYSLADVSPNVEEVKKKPCELVGFLPLGDNVGQKAAISAAVYLGIPNLFPSLEAGTKVRWLVNESFILHEGKA
jgi:hypothetical protein